MILTNYDGIPFRILRDGRSVTYTDWRIVSAAKKEHVPYSNITITERMGHAPAVVTWRLRFHRKDDYFAFLAKLGTVGTLTVMAGFQSLKGTQVTLGNPPRWYEVLDQVSVEDIRNQEIALDGSVELDCTFERQIDPLTRLAVM